MFFSLSILDMFTVFNFDHHIKANPMRNKGKIISWESKKAYGFIETTRGGKHIFLHKSGLNNHHRTPVKGDVITFTLTKDHQGRDCAEHATFAGEKRIKKSVSHKNMFSIYLSVGFLIGMGLAVLLKYLPITLFIAYLALSLLTFIIYALDKSSARKGGWRIQEKTLHTLAIMGGWPGAALAQQLLRHKSKKQQFIIVFWVTIVINVGLLAWLISIKAEQYIPVF